MVNLLPQTVNANKTFTLVVTGAELNLNTASALFGSLVAGALTLHYSGLSHISTASTLASPLETELENASKVWTEILVGIWIVGVRMWVTGNDGMLVGLKETSIALSIMCVVVASTVGVATWAKGREINRVDGKVLNIPVDDIEGSDGLPMLKWKTDEIFVEE